MLLVEQRSLRTDGSARGDVHTLGCRHNHSDCRERPIAISGGMIRRTCALLGLLAACAPDTPAPSPTAAVAPERPLDGPLLGPAAVRTAVLIEAALAQVRPTDLRRCVDEFGSSGFRLPAHGRWLIVASALPVGGAGYARRIAAAPELVAEPDDDWLDRITYRTLLHASAAQDRSVACLSCVFDYAAGRVVYRHAYGLDTCRRAVPPERDFAIVVPPV